MMQKVLVVTGGLLNEKETSVLRALRKQSLQWRAAQAAWLDLKIKLVMAEPMIAGQAERVLGRRRLSPLVREYFANTENLSAPELTEVVLLTLLAQEGMAYGAVTVDEIFANTEQARSLLAECCCVFLSATLLRDLSEVEPLVKRLKRAHNRVVIGGALGGTLVHDWAGMPEVDVLAVGYGEMLVPELVRYIRSGFTKLVAPASGSLEKRASTHVLRSGVPNGSDLDFLPTPDWAQAERDHGRKFPMVYYESVRGCPYRCNFCNYPYLFDDTRFRYKSAKKIADDWQRYREETGAQYVTCLDSLFTMPRRRLVELCDELVKRQLGLKWICYARADDLAHPEIAAMMKEAGAHQVQIGVESGDQGILDNMDKQCTVEANHQALVNCRAVGLTSVVSLIVGFPGETPQTMDTTLAFLAATPPDFYFLATFSTRVAGVPILNSFNRDRFDLRTDSNPHTVAPYWEHATMSAADVGNHVRHLHQRIMAEKISLNAPLFYAGLLGYRPEQRSDLLDFQHRVATQHPVVTRSMNLANAWLDRHLRRDMARWRAQ
jgi:anaerobic magnesium-protoporphyrin IX monomethyl ester cyclase